MTHLGRFRGPTRAGAPTRAARTPALNRRTLGAKSAANAFGLGGLRAPPQRTPSADSEITELLFHGVRFGVRSLLRRSPFLLASESEAFCERSPTLLASESGGSAGPAEATFQRAHWRAPMSSRKRAKGPSTAASTSGTATVRLATRASTSASSVTRRARLCLPGPNGAPFEYFAHVPRAPTLARAHALAALPFSPSTCSSSSTPPSTGPSVVALGALISTAAAASCCSCCSCYYRCSRA